MNKSDIKEYLNKRIQDVEKCYQNLIKPYYVESINMISISGMTKKEKEEFINQRNCLLVQKETYNEILQFLEGTQINTKK